MDRDTKETIRMLRRLAVAAVVLLGILTAAAACYLIVSTLKLLAG